MGYESVKMAAFLGFPVPLWAKCAKDTDQRTADLYVRHKKMLACLKPTVGGSWGSGCAIDNGPLNLKAGAGRSAIVVGSSHNPDGMPPRT
jgi:hypothetical protein